MKVLCLSVRQPWASLILRPGPNGKRVENRSWTIAHRGLLAIHASSSRADWDVLAEEDKDRYLPEWRITPPEYGAVLGVVRLVRICRPHQLPEELRHHAFVDSNPNNWCWVVDQPRRLTQPHIIRGQSRVFYVEFADALLDGFSREA